MLRWFGHVKRRPQSAPVRRVEAMVVEGSRRRGRPKLRWEDRLKMDMKELRLSEDMTSDRNAWRDRIRISRLVAFLSDRSLLWPLRRFRSLNFLVGELVQFRQCGLSVGGVVEAAAGCGWFQRRRRKEVVGLLEVFEGCLERRAKPKVKEGE
nr:polyprotein, putative [Tanacetum cinerariifolium]